MRHFATAAVLTLLAAVPAEGQRSLERFNRQLAGYIVDFTRNHGQDNRIFSEVLGECRDLYVYLPPGYDPSQSYSLVFWLHGAFGDEHGFLTTSGIRNLDEMIAAGRCPPVIVACPDGTLNGRNRLTSPHSFYINGPAGHYEDYIMEEIVPFIEAQFSVRPEREAHGLGGPSAGGFGALALAIKRRDYFSAVTAVASPVNMRYSNCREKYFANFDPAKYEWRTDYDPKEVVGKFAFGLFRLRAKTLLATAFGPPEALMANIRRENPADLIRDTELQPGELRIYLNYPTQDNFNFDAHNESFAWLAQQQGLEVTVERDRCAQHLLGYFRRNQPHAHEWLCNQLLPPAPAAAHQPEPSPISASASAPAPAGQP